MSNTWWYVTNNVKEWDADEWVEIFNELGVEWDIRLFG
jgi:hypothetical protein